MNADSYETFVEENTLWKHQILTRDKDGLIRPQPLVLATQWTPGKMVQGVEPLPTDVEPPALSDGNPGERAHYGWFDGGDRPTMVRPNDWILKDAAGTLSHVPDAVMRPRIHDGSVAVIYAGPMSFHDAMAHLESKIEEASLHVEDRGSVLWDPTSKTWRCVGWQLAHAHTRDQYQPRVAAGEVTGVRTIHVGHHHPFQKTFRAAFGDELGLVDVLAVHRECPSCGSLAIASEPPPGFASCKDCVR
jgi:hypothetical protein